LINEKKAEECFDLLGALLNTSDDSEYNFEGNKIKLNQFIPIFMKHLFKIAKKYPERSEPVMNFIVEAIQYTLDYTDEVPRINYVSQEEMNWINNNGHDEPKVKVKTK